MRNPLSIGRTAGAAALCLFLAAFAAGAQASQGTAAEAQGQTVSTVLPAAGALDVKPDERWRAVDPKCFTGKAFSLGAFRQPAPARGYGAYVYFEPGARTFWHVHPLGQTLVVVAGTGLTQALEPDGNLGPVAVLRPGDVVRCPPGIMHWHGAAPHSAMTHLAVSESDPARPVLWRDPVDEAAYQRGARQALGETEAQSQ